MSRAHRIVVSEFFEQGALDLMRRSAEVEYDPTLFRRTGELRELLGNADALVVRNQTPVRAELVEGTPVRVVGRVGVGLDNLDRPGLRAAGVTAIYTPGMNAVSVAEYTIGAILGLLKRFAAVSSHVHNGIWDRQGSIGLEASGRVLGIVGIGDIGGRVARLARAFGMAVKACDPAVGPDSSIARELNVEMLALDELLAVSDVVTIHTPLEESTRGLIGPAQLHLMKRGSYLVNSARGGIVDEEALAEVLREGRLAGAAVDVRPQEPPVGIDYLAGLPNVLLTPHVAGVTEESMRRACMQVAEDVLRVLTGERPSSPVPAGSG